MSATVSRETGKARVWINVKIYWITLTSVNLRSTIEAIEFPIRRLPFRL